VRAPKKHSNGWHWIPPNGEWLYDQYVVQEKAAQQIAKEIGGHPNTVLMWLTKEGIHSRTLAEAKALLRGRRSSLWKGGDESTFHLEARRVLQEVGVPRRCGEPNASPVGCGVNEGWLEVHHIDENIENNVLENLQYLCKGCHVEVSRELRLESLSKVNGYRSPRRHPNGFWWDPPSRKWLTYYRITLG